MHFPRPLADLNQIEIVNAIETAQEEIIDEFDAFTYNNLTADGEFKRKPKTKSYIVLDIPRSERYCCSHMFHEREEQRKKLEAQRAKALLQRFVTSEEYDALIDGKHIIIPSPSGRYYAFGRDVHAEVESLDHNIIKQYICLHSKNFDEILHWADGILVYKFYIESAEDEFRALANFSNPLRITLPNSSILDEKTYIIPPSRPLTEEEIRQHEEDERGYDEMCRFTLERERNFEESIIEELSW